MLVYLTIQAKDSLRLTSTATASATAPRGLVDPTSAASTATVTFARPGVGDLAFTGVAIGGDMGIAGVCLAAGLIILFVRRGVTLG